jgi:hypothetical protein
MNIYDSNDRSSLFFRYNKNKMSTTTTIEPKKESLGISAALILSLVGLTVSEKSRQFFVIVHLFSFFSSLLY